MQLCSLHFTLRCISWVYITIGKKVRLVYNGNTECVRINNMVMSEYQNIQRFVLVWIAIKSADDYLNALDLSKQTGDPSTEEFWPL